MNKKILLITPDGVGLKNFGYSEITHFLDNEGIQVVFWNSTPFNFNKLGLTSIKLSNTFPSKADLLKRAKIEIELDDFSKRFRTDVFQTYKFPFKTRSLKAFIKKVVIGTYKLKYKNRRYKIQNQINTIILNSLAYKDAFKKLSDEKPDLLFCSNQRASNCIAPILAAKNLNIPTACFIFSWDNLPKATKIIDTDYYFVWSDFMKNELLQYYQHIKEHQIKIVGTPQFEYHYATNQSDLEAFRKKYNLSIDTKYILFSGDDITTSPKDEEFLESVCQSIKELNKRSAYKLRVLFRRCPVDFSNRYDEILKIYSDILIEVKPIWNKQGEMWNTVLPTKADAKQLALSIKVSDLVINLGSSMVFDAVCHNKPCAYINFNPKGIDLSKWSVKKIYNFIHFQSMPNKDAVIWLNSKEEISDKILEGLNNPKKYVENAQKWFEVINQQPASQASERIVKAINQIIST
ncbi:UDP-N-acetylglucosamine:LPS N-acetylglucosamine transferase [Psychroflexus salarius]|uniref:UDP-N-acetylglucosamine:LPS N-acetylglucosamine transferase n=1 Tax=Psychroflexus salarius TaxID=1155689 RepID=A0A1M4X392_9FLAO|nr:hypothetical protein [Psychroflexus salarius]SHE87935.1 UDP-N-acetylglucosamine:LPS N-acetylglucosamine transferase [Psychroflexus salarius]